MQPTVLTLDPWNPRKDIVDQAADALRQGQVLLVPTDTTWALICDAQQRSAVAKLTSLRTQAHRLRGEEQELAKRPMALMCPDISAVGTFTLMDQQQFRLIKRLLPGPYTVILPVSREVPRLLRDKRKTIGIRLPAFPITEAILQSFGAPVYTTTARDDHGDLLLSAADLHHELQSIVDCIVESDPIVPEESTVIDATVDPPHVLRKGLGEVEEHWQTEA